ncbi:hypothetical protein ACA910_020114 [Epithemia clementina (nom. ined.)]
MVLRRLFRNNARKDAQRNCKHMALMEDPKNAMAAQRAESSLTDDTLETTGSSSRSCGEPEQRQGSSISSISISRREAILKFKTQEESLQQNYGKVKDTKCDHETEIAAPPQRTRRIVFASVTVYYHNTILADTPSVSEGPPVGLGHKCLGQDAFDSMEQAHQAGACGPVAAWDPTNGKKRLIIPPNVRERMLRAAGVSKQEIRQCIMFQKLLIRQQQMGKTYVFY